MMFFDKSASIRTTVLAGLALSILSASQAHAATVTDASSCAAAVQNSEKAIVKAKVPADVLDKLVSMAEQANNACVAQDFSTASVVTDAIEKTIEIAAQK